MAAAGRLRGAGGARRAGRVLEEAVKSGMRRRDEPTRRFRLCCEGCLALGDGGAVEMRQFCGCRCLGSALRSCGTALGKDGERGLKSRLLLEEQPPVRRCAGGSGGGHGAPPEG